VGKKSGTRRGLSFRVRIFIALVGISAATSLIIGLVLYYFAQQRLIYAESELLVQRSRTANSDAVDFLEGLRNPEDRSLPEPRTYAEELVRSVSDPTGLGVLYVGPEGKPLAARDGLGNSMDPGQAYEKLGLRERLVQERAGSEEGSGLLVPARGDTRYATVWPLTATGGESRGVMAYYTPRDGLDPTLAYLRYGILGAILTSVLLAGMASLLLTRQITRPLSETRDAAIRIASGDYAPMQIKRADELGEVTRAFNYMAEEVKHYVSELQEQKGRLEAVLESSPDAVVATDANERITMANPAAAQMLGIRASDQGRPLSESVTFPEVLQCLREAERSGVAVREAEAGEKTYWAYAARMDRGARNGQAQGIIVVVRDITEHRALERAKTDFVSDVSHELRNPLTTIHSAVDLLARAEERLDPLERRALELAQGELRRIRGMVEELLTLAQIDSRQYFLEVGPADLTTVLGNSVEAISPKAERFGIDLTFEEHAEHHCVCDRQKLYRVFLNLLDNAVKYTDPGGKVVTSVVEDGSSLKVRVQDTGVGIPEADLEHLFDRFYRVDKARSRATGGTGLGLAISRQIVALHGGEISVESRLGEGSTFEVSLPKSPVPSPTGYAA
jgi:PAS domain S-box-containing protein